MHVRFLQIKVLRTKIYKVMTEISEEGGIMVEDEFSERFEGCPAAMETRPPKEPSASSTGASLHARGGSRSSSPASSREAQHATDNGTGNGSSNEDGGAGAGATGTGEKQKTGNKRRMSNLAAAKKRANSSMLYSWKTPGKIAYFLN